MRGKKYTVMVIPSADKPVLRAGVPVYLLYLIPGLILFAAMIITMWIYFAKLAYIHEIVALHDRLSNQKVSADRIITSKEETIDTLRAEVLELSNEASEVRDKIAELQELEQRVREMSDIEEPKDEDAALPVLSASAEDRTGVGGPDHPLRDDDIVAMADETGESLLQLNLQIEQMSGRLSYIMDELEKLDYAERHTPNFWPADNRRISSVFGVRKDPFNGSFKMHRGMDIPGRTGDPVYAAAEGKVITAETGRGQGKYIVLEHSKSLRTVYMHLSKISVKPGESVKKGERIGSIGSTGRSTGPHLHFEVHKNGSPVNPRPYLE